MSYEDQSISVEKSPALNKNFLTDEIFAEVIRMRMEATGSPVIPKEWRRALHGDPVTIDEAERAAARIDARESAAS